MDPPNSLYKHLELGTKLTQSYFFFLFLKLKFSLANASSITTWVTIKTGERRKRNNCHERKQKEKKRKKRTSMSILASQSPFCFSPNISTTFAPLLMPSNEKFLKGCLK